MPLLFASLLGACTWISDRAVDNRAGAIDAGDSGEAAACGRTTSENLPDETTAEMTLDDSSVDFDTLVAQQLGVVSAAGCADTLTGSLTLSGTGWNSGNDSDAYLFTVRAACHARLTASWTDPDADLDFGIWGPEGLDLFSSAGASHCLGSERPATCEMEGLLEPEHDYWLVALGYLGAGEHPYEIQAEWIAP